MKRVPTILLVLLSIALGAAGKEKMRLDPTVPHLGERATLTLSHAAKDSTEFPIGIHAAIQPTEDPTRFTLIPLQVGMVGATLPESSDTLYFAVPATMDPDSLPAPRPLQSIGILRPTWWPTIAGFLLILSPLAYLTMRWLRRGKTPAVAFPLVAEAAHLVALRKLQEIEDSRLLREGEFDAYYVAVSHTLRAYLAGRFRVSALDWTVSEMKDRLAAAGYEQELFSAALDLLKQADEIKFARGRPTEHQAREWLEAARSYIHDTKVEPVYTTQESVKALVKLQEVGG
jgi:hypothetical protein